jgi:hypothetical protein
MEEANKTKEGIRQLKEGNASLLEKVKAIEIKDLRKRKQLQEVRSAAQVVDKRADAAEKEVKYLKRKRAASTSPPPPQIKLLVRPHTLVTHQPASPSSARTESLTSVQPASKRYCFDSRIHTWPVIQRIKNIHGVLWCVLDGEFPRVYS